MPLLVVALIALAAPASSSATFAASAGGEPAVTNTASNTHWFGWNANADNSAYCITVYLNGSGTSNNRGCVPSNSTYYPYNTSGTFSQTENPLADGTLVGAPTRANTFKRPASTPAAALIAPPRR